MTDHSASVKEAADRVAEKLRQLLPPIGSDERHDLLGDFSLVRYWAESAISANNKLALCLEESDIILRELQNAQGRVAQLERERESYSTARIAELEEALEKILLPKNAARFEQRIARDALKKGEPDG
jgi:hypothetical protein